MKSTINLLDNLPEEIIYIIWEYHHIPFLQDIKTFKFNPTKFSTWRKHIAFIFARFRPLEPTTIIYKYLDDGVSGRFIELCGYNVWGARAQVIIRMKKNNLRVRRGMKTITMKKHLMKL